MNVYWLLAGNTLPVMSHSSRVWLSCGSCLPYYIFYKIARHNLGLDIAAAYGTFIVIPLMLVAFIGKWVLLGGVTEGDLPKEITVYYGDGFIYC